MSPEALRRGLAAWTAAVEAGQDRVGAAAAAADALAQDPWAVVEVAGALARARVEPAPTELALDAALSPRPPGDPRGLASIPAGAPWPAPDRAGRRAAGGYDTPPDLARRVVGLALRSARGPARSGGDLACGAGAFLVAMAEAGLSELRGLELDPAAAEVASRAAPRARVERLDGASAEVAGLDIVVGNPPFVPSNRQDPVLRDRLARRFPWLRGRYDLAVPFAELAAEAARPGGGVALILPAALMCQPYAEVLRRRWVARHAIRAIEGPLRFPSARVDVHVVAIQVGAGPAPLPDHGLDPGAWATLGGAPWESALEPGDPAIVARLHAGSVPLGALCEVDTGLVAHGAHGGKQSLIFDDPAPGRVPYVDAADLLVGRRRWLAWRPEAMHRPKRPALFEAPKVLVQRIGGVLRAWVDREGLYAGHTLTVLRPRDPARPVERLAALLAEPAMAGLLRLERGVRLDLYPRDLAALPVPRRWFDADAPGLADALDLPVEALARLRAFATLRHCPGHR